MSTKNVIAPVAASELQVVEYRGLRVVTTEQLAAGYGATEQMITNNFNRNKQRFVEGKHYFKLAGEEVEILRNSFRGLQISPKARSLTLWTERGAANHAKMLETDQAWGYHDDLVEFYFSKREAIASPVDAMKMLNDPSTLRSLLLNYSGDNERLKGENQHLSATVESLEKHFTKGLTIPAFCKGLNGVNVSKMMWWAHERDWIYNEQRDPEKDPRWRVASYARDKYLTEDKTQITPHGMEAFTRYSPVLLEKGSQRLYQLYMKGELPMKKSWNGEYSHDKAIYSAEVGL